MIKSYLQAFFIGLPTFCHRPPLLGLCHCMLSEPLAPAWNLTTPYVAAQLGSGDGTVANQDDNENTGVWKKESAFR